MKKTLLLGSFALMGLMASAQTSVSFATSEALEALGLTTDAADYPAGTLIAEGEAGTLELGAADQWKIFTPAGNYKNITVNGVEVTLSAGVTGSTNPSPNTLDGAPENGAFYVITPEADGWVTVFTKLNTNKQYVVFEGKTTPMSYTLGWTNGTEKIQYTLPADENYALDLNSPDIDKYVDVSTMKPYMPWQVAGYAEQQGENTGFLTFNAMGGLTYYFAAYGSKAACGGFTLTEGDAEPVVVFKAVEGDNPLPEVVFGNAGGDSGVATVGANVDKNAPIYNLMGQKVSADAKGVLIQNGKKFIRK